MLLTQITFGTDNGNPGQCELMADAAGCYLISLIKNGQIFDKYLTSWVGRNFVAHAYIPRPNALANRHLSEWGKSDLKKVVEMFGCEPSHQILSDHVSQRHPAWKRSSSFCLFTNWNDDTTPLYCSDTQSVIPLYLLSLPGNVTQDLIFWADEYKDFDKIWMRSGEFEIPAYKQLADPASELSVKGRDLCAIVERATGIPTYYYLQRHWGRREGEQTRPCPGCGGKWHTDKKNQNDQGFYLYHHQCKKCRLISNSAFADDDQRHARIGEYKKPKGSK